MSQEEIDTSNLVAVTGSVVAPGDKSDRQQESDRIASEVIALRDRMASDYFELGRLLYRMNHEGLWALQKNPATGKPYERFKDWVETVSDMQYRKAKYLMSTWYWFARRIGSPKVSEKIKEIGWTKASKLVGIVDERNVDTWVEKAKRLTVGKLDEECKLALAAAERKARPTIPNKATEDDLAAAQGKVMQKTGANGKPLISGALPSPIPFSGKPEQVRMGVDPIESGEVRDTRIRWGCLLTKDQIANVDRAIDVASQMGEVSNDGKGYLLDFIATHFLTFQVGAIGDNDERTRDNFRRDFLERVEYVLGIELMAVLPGTNELVYGEEVVHRIEDEKEGA